MKTATPAGQLDMFAEADREAYEALPTTCLYASTARGLDARAVERQDTPKHVHAWSISMCVPKERSARCQATVLSAHLIASHRETQSCPLGDHGINDLMYRGACLGVGCTWEGEPHDRENPAAEDAMDHAWPGWRDMPIVPPPPFSDAKGTTRWLVKVTPLYPHGWIADGGPVRTARRDAIGGRHHGPATFHGGYDMGVVTPEEPEAR